MRQSRACRQRSIIKPPLDCRETLMESEMSIYRTTGDGAGAGGGVRDRDRDGVGAMTCHMRRAHIHVHVLSTECSTKCNEASPKCHQHTEKK